MPFYAVKVGRQPGVYESWAECEAQVRGFSKPVYRKFESRDAAENFARNEAVKKGGPLRTTSHCGPFYAVKDGFNRGIYETWPDCQAQVSGYKGARYKKFKTYDEALDFLGLSAPIVALASKLPEVASTSQKAEAASQKAKVASQKAKVGRVASDGSLEDRSEPLSCRSLMTKLLNPVGSSTPLGAPGRKRKSSGEGIAERGAKKTKKSEVVVLPDDLEPLDLRETEHVVYTDGGCFNNGRKEARAGYGVWWGRDHPWNESRRLLGQQTNNRAEIEAAIAAVARAHKEGIERLEIRTDSQFLISCITKWVKGWRKNGWKLKTGGEVKVREAIERLDDLLAASGVKVVWTHVRGHVGIVGNEAADRLARWGAFDSDSSFDSLQ